MGQFVRYRFIVTVAVVASFLIASGQSRAARDETESRAGRVIQQFTAQDFRGKEHALADYKQSKVLVVAFLGTECPLAKLYTTRLNELAARYQEQGVQFLGIDANQQDSMTEIAAYARQHNITFPILKDVGNTIADQFAAVRTPEVFVLDADRVVRYWGRVDDQYGVGYIRNEPTRNDLELAIGELLAGKEVSVATTPAPGCHIGRVKEAKESSPITYSKQISRILQNRCVECHRADQIAPFALTDYDEVVGWAEMIAEVVEDQRMPPWHADPKFGHFTNDRSLTQEEKETIFAWVDAGAPEGDPAELPAPKEYVTGWQLPQQPDVVLQMNDEPFDVPAEGTVRYQYFKVDTGFKEDKWAKAFQVIPGNLAVVHHILVFAVPKGERPENGGATGFLAGYVPGLVAIPFPDGMAKKIEAGSELIFQIHYTPIGTEQQDLSSIGIVLANDEEITHQVKTTSALRPDLLIPPNADNHRLEANTKPSKYEVQLLGMMPHMHLRGKSFFYEAVYPDGEKETLLNVPAYDFNWQTGYRLETPKTLPQGTVVHVIGHYDNSADNLNNPNPNETVSWGEQTWDEMLIGYFDVAFPIADIEKGDAFSPDMGDRRGRNRRPEPEEIFTQLDHNKDDQLEESEIPRNFRAFISRVDLNKDKIVTKSEFMNAVAAAKAMEGARDALKPGSIMKKYDKNKDDKIAKDEVPRLLWPVISRADKDGDGLLTIDELKSLQR